MASTDAIPVPRKNAAFRFHFAIRKNDGTLVTTWAGQDSEVSKDGGSFADCTNEATEIGTSGCGYIDLTSTEMNADCVMLKVTVTNTDALTLVFVFYPESEGDYRCDTVQIAGSTTAAGNLGKSALGIVSGACESTPSTTSIQTDLAETTNGHYIGRVVVFTSGDAAGEATDITGYTGATGTLTVTALTTAPAATDTFVIV